jgi:peptidoglycan/xylan/chitin deacetylase (PgdA/CDA1 family)
MDEARERIIAGDASKRFACFTLDDGYRDNVRNALPVFRKHDVPFTVYVPSAFADGDGELWRLALEKVIAGADEVAFDFGDGPERIPASGESEKQLAYHRIYWWLRACDEDRQREAVSALCESHDLDQRRLCRDVILTWDELRELGREPLATVGAHTARHFAVGKLSQERARSELAEGADRLASELGARPRHLSYPYGDVSSAGPRDFALAGELGFETAVTTRKGVVFPDHKDHLMALPRVSLNGAYQSLVYTSLYLTGAPFALWNGFRKVDAA